MALPNFEEAKAYIEKKKVLNCRQSLEWAGPWRKGIGHAKQLSKPVKPLTSAFG